MALAFLHLSQSGFCASAYSTVSTSLAMMPACFPFSVRRCLTTASAAPGMHLPSGVSTYRWDKAAPCLHLPSGVSTYRWDKAAVALPCPAHAC